MDKVDMAIARLRQASDMSLLLYEQPLVITISGGKDSSVILDLAGKAGIPYEVLHNHTTADAPETVRFVRSEFARLESVGIKCIYSLPVYKGERTSMWSLIPQKRMPPTRFARYCCQVLKEESCRDRYIVTGVRWAESARRKASRAPHEIQHRDKAKTVLMLSMDSDEERRTFETCQLKGKRICNPIVDWSDDDVWDYLQAEHVDVNPLYAEGWRRVGCVGCPMAGKHRHEDFARWPKYREMYLHAFDRMLKARAAAGRGNKVWGDTAADVMHWWMEDGVLPGQMTMFGEDERP